MLIYNIEPREFNNKLAVELKKIDEFKIPEWMFFVKSGVNKQRPPANPDFWYNRIASILRKMYITKRPLGVNRLKSIYGGRKDRGVKPAEFRTAGGKIIRIMLQQAESAGLIEKNKTGKAGRVLSDKGKKLLESIGGHK
ncbi:MAG TPA: 40S ribosomal protein S19 [Candidatus Paceibacterota bacterium]|nr:40S ribosomal protein S19 [Candidatus Paceibacterota bacterium]